MIAFLLACSTCLLLLLLLQTWLNHRSSLSNNELLNSILSQNFQERAALRESQSFLVKSVAAKSWDQVVSPQQTTSNYEAPEIPVEVPEDVVFQQKDDDIFDWLKD